MNIKHIDKMTNYIKKKCQTLTYRGFQSKEFENLISENNLLGADRIVPIGQAFNFNLNWDGIDTINILSRSVSFE